MQGMEEGWTEQQCHIEMFTLFLSSFFRFSNPAQCCQLLRSTIKKDVPMLAYITTCAKLMAHNPVIFTRRLRLSAGNAVFERVLSTDFADAQSRDFQLRGAIGVDERGMVIKFGRPRRPVEDPADPTLRSMHMYSESDEEFHLMTHDVWTGDWNMEGMSKVYPNRDLVYVNANNKRKEAAQKAILERWTTSKSSVLLSVMFGQTKMNPGVGRVGEFLGDYTITILTKPSVVVDYVAARRNRRNRGETFPYHPYRMNVKQEIL
jgi:hypothetical protein